MGRRESEVLAAFLGGMMVGAAVAVLLRPRSRGGSLHSGEDAVTGSVVVPPPVPPRPRGVPPEEARGRGGWLERRGGEAVLDLPGLRARLADEHPAHPVELGLLSPGIVEVVGMVDTPETARAVLGRVGAEPGVRTVVNRLWVQGDTL